MTSEGDNGIAPIIYSRNRFTPTRQLKFSFAKVERTTLFLNLAQKLCFGLKVRTL